MPGEGVSLTRFGSEESEMEGMGVGWTVLGGYDWDLPFTTFSSLFLGRLCFLQLSIYCNWNLQVLDL